MSTYFNQCIAYGYVTTLKEFNRIVGQKWFEDDDLRMDNNENGFGWFVTDEFAFYGKQLIYGESNGNDSLIAATRGYVKMPRIDASDFATVCKNLEDMFGESKDRECDYYTLGGYN